MSTTNLPFSPSTAVVSHPAMLIGERVAQRMSAEGLSQAELARRVGISQQAVGKLIHGNSRKTTHIVRLARELATTPAYLEGETDDPQGSPAPPPALDSETRELNERFAGFASADRRALLQIARSMSPDQPTSATLHSPTTAYRAEPGLVLPSEDALARMFEAFLMLVDPHDPQDETARTFAKQLPTALETIRALVPIPTSDDDDADEEEPDILPMPRSEPRRARRT